MQTQSGTTTDLAVDGMTCGGCARNVTAALQGVDGVDSVNVALEAKRASVRWKPGAAMDDQRLVRAVTQAGYDARLLADSHEEHAPGRVAARTWAVNVLAGVIPTALLMIGEWGFRWQNFPVARWVAGVL